MDEQDAHAETYGRRLLATAIIVSTALGCVTVVLVVVLVLLFG